MMSSLAAAVRGNPLLRILGLEPFSVASQHAAETAANLAQLSDARVQSFPDQLPRSLPEYSVLWLAVLL